MENKTKVILTALGLAAIVVPAALLVVFSGRLAGEGAQAVPESGARPLRQEVIKDEADKIKPSPQLVSPIPTPSPSPSPTPSPTSSPLEATGEVGLN